MLIEAADFFTFFLVFLILVYINTVNSEYSMDIYKSVKTSIGTVMRNPEMLKLVPDHFKKKIMCEHVVKILPFLKRYVPDQYKTNV